MLLFYVIYFTFVKFYFCILNEKLLFIEFCFYLAMYEGLTQNYVIVYMCMYVWLNKNIIKNWINRTNSNHISLILFYFFKVNWIKLNRTIFFFAVQISFNVKIIQTAPQTPLPTATSLITSHSMATTLFIYYLQSNYYYEYHFDYFQLPL